MRHKITIVSDSIACFTKKQLKNYQIEIVPIHIIFEGKVYRDFIDLSSEKAYRFLEKNPKEWKSSTPSPGDFLNVFEKLIKKGQKIICLTLAKELSTTFNSARLAKDIIKQKSSSVKIEVIDTKTASVGENLLGVYAGKLVNQGKDFAEIVNFIKKLREKVQVYGLLETVRYVYRTGRIPEIGSKIGSFLSLKPILKISNGKISFIKILKDKEKGKKKLLEILKKDYDQNFPEIGIFHASCKKEAEEFKEKIKREIPNSKIFISEFSPIMGYATGRGTILIGFFGK